MGLLDEIMSAKTNAERIAKFKQKVVSVPDWGKIQRLYYPRKHKIVYDKIGRKDKEDEEGNIEKAARIPLGLEQLIVSRMAGFMFALPVKRVYSEPDASYTDEEVASYKRMIRAIEKVYKVARVNTENLARAKSYFATCEIFTLWYSVKQRNKKYGFDSNYKFKCRTYSALDAGTKLYPLFDESGDMIAMSIEYRRKVETKEVTYFETWTKDKHFRWSNGKQDWNEELNEDISSFGKIPGVYISRNEPIYGDCLCDIRHDLEYKYSENSDTISYNSAPIIKVAGGTGGMEKKGEARRIIRCEAGGDVSYVSWQQSVDVMKFHTDSLIDMYFMLAQLPNISASKMMELSNVSYESRQMLFADAHMKVGDESGAWYEFLEREFNVIKELLKSANPEWKDMLDDVECDFVITPFIQNDEKAAIEKVMSANGGKPVISHLTSIKQLDIVDDPEAEFARIQEEEKESAPANPFENMFTE